ncbi:hypothetical protein sos41_11900 [Alphaproteobacteria bacterium SO-S41]|nr:hypothetical protein sos41_11900 [Alphaproteobacteria bacterium SO-S41]
MGGLVGVHWANAKALARPGDWPLIVDAMKQIEAAAVKAAARKAEQDREDKAHG